ncbi:GNAT family N-acetyltransferase [Gluconacetobacter azotocaptans]|uniref:GNAT family N-acetyltransferase n=1 Tax=Gluconacetobacter azotocaptans TaxID=142834 RepID=A0A7W4JR36_9PROT|nr:GNAT family protein [Gluconacetobacter azotocaptans]MBB2189341.1 GNAT family N-acetyltransferase [Gluconacetobacter azotocaptans]GBQ28621.1 acetyltransferase [Gluconacetobacter azotocaptans DSM 13594]
MDALCPEHALEMFDGLSDPAAYRFLSDDPPDTMAALRSRYTRQAAGRSPDVTQQWLNWVVRRADDGRAAGYIQATIQGDGALIGHQIFPSFWRQGLATAALQATICRLFSTDGVENIAALIDTRNEGSIGLVEKFGFRRIGTVKGADYFKGASSTEHEYALSRSGWHDCPLNRDS